MAKVAIFSLNTHFLLDFGDLDKSFSLGNAHASLALRSLNHVFIVHEALVLALTFIILEKLLNRVCLENASLFLLGKIFQSVKNLLIAASHISPHNIVIKIGVYQQCNHCDYSHQSRQYPNQVKMGNIEP